MLAGVGAVRHAESEIKVEGLEMTILEEMSLYHPELLNRFGPDRKLHCGPDGLELEELRSELIPAKKSMRGYVRQTGECIRVKENKTCVKIHE